jgi:1-acyl-sn-glycerol-3-phosphate acyltransferase
MRNILRITFNLLFRTLTRLTITGLENIPNAGGCLVTSNHIAILDAPLIFSLIKRDDATGLVAKKHQRNAVIHWVVNKVGGIWIDRTRPDIQALKECQDYVKNGGLLGIAPEGTRSKTGGMIDPKPGVAFLAARLAVPIIPIAITGTENAREILRLGRPKINVNVGKPFYLPPIDRKNRDASLNQNTDEIMCRVAALLPHEYRGVYADHPRLHEFLS